MKPSLTFSGSGEPGPGQYLGTHRWKSVKNSKFTNVRAKSISSTFKSTTDRSVY